MSLIDQRQVLEHLTIDVVSISLFALALYLRRHRRADMAMVFWFFNLCLFVTVTVIQMTEVAAALGFGLFAILSIIRLRSEPFSNREIGYFVGALVLGLLNGVGAGSLPFTVLLNGVVLLAMALLDHPGVLPRSERCSVVFDRIFTDDAELTLAVGERIGREVDRVEIVSIDYVRDAMQLEVRFAPAPRRAGLRLIVAR